MSKKEERYKEMNKQQALSIARTFIGEQYISKVQLLNCIKFGEKERADAIAAFTQELESRLGPKELAELRDVLRHMTLPDMRPYWCVSYLIDYGDKLAVLALQIDEETGEITMR